MEQEITPSVSDPNFNKYAIPLKMGLMTGVFKIILSTISYQFFIGSWGMTIVFMLLSFIMMVVMLCITGKQQRNALGGFMDIKQAFQALFVAAVIVAALDFFYDLLYATIIDPDMVVKIKESSLAAAERMGAPQEKLDEMAENFDKQSETKMSFGKQVFSLAVKIVWYGIVAFLCAAAVKKEKPVLDQ